VVWINVDTGRGSSRGDQDCVPHRVQEGPRHKRSRVSSGNKQLCDPQLAVRESGTVEYIPPVQSARHRWNLQQRLGQELGHPDCGDSEPEGREQLPELHAHLGDDGARRTGLSGWDTYWSGPSNIQQLRRDPDRQLLWQLHDCRRSPVQLGQGCWLVARQGFSGLKTERQRIRGH